MWWIVKILSFFVLLLLVVLSFAATIPLRFIVEHVPNFPLPAQITHVQGTITHGDVSLLLQNLPLPPAVSSKMRTLTVAWQWCPSFDTGLLATCIEVDTELAQGVFTTVISPVATKLYDISITSKLDKLSVPIANRPTEISGEMQLSLSNVAIPFSAPFPSQIQGEITLKDVVIGIFELGDFHLDLSSKENEELHADIKSNGELFSSQGVANLNKDGQYRYSIDVESANTLVRNFLSKQGQINDKDGYRLAKTGVLPM